MSDVKLFRIQHGDAVEVAGSAVALERSLQVVIEANLPSLLGVTFLDTEYSTGPEHGGRIDTLGIDENGCPVIIEYKRATKENVINQGLFYLDWLLDHKAEFHLLVLKTLAEDVAERIDWSSPRLICIAGGFTRYDEHAVKQINRNIELMRYRRFGDDLLMLELVNTGAAQTNGSPGGAGGATTSYKTISETLSGMKGPLKDLYEAVRADLLALGDDVQEKVLKYYVAMKRIKNLACIEVHPGKKCVTVYLRVPPASVSLEEGFTRDVTEVGHYGTGDLEVTLRTPQDLVRAQPLFQLSYEAS